MYGFLCNPFSVTSQIKASKVQVQSTIIDGDKSAQSALDDADASLMDSSLPTQSRPKPKFSLFRKASIQTLTDELYSFVMDIRWNYETYQQFERKLLDSRGSFLTYTFDFSPLSPKSKLVKLLRQEFELNSNLWFSVEDIDNAVLSMTVLLENYFEYPPSFDHSSPYNQNCFTSLEYTFICSDILLAGLWRFYSLVPPAAVAPHESHLSHIRKFLAAVVQLYSLVGEEERLACGVAMCQIAMKASQVVHLLVMKVLEDIWNVGAIFKAVDLVYLLQEFLSIVVSVPSCGQLTQYLLTMKLWILIDILLRTVNRQIVFTESSVHMLQLYKNKLWKLAIEMMASSHALVGAMQAQETQEVHPLSGMNEEGMERMIFDVITTAGSHQNGSSLLTLFALNDFEETASNSSHQGKAPSIALPWSLQLNTPFYLRFLVLSMIKVVHLDTTAITYRNKHLLQGSSSINMPMDVDQVLRVVYEVFVFTTKDKIVVERLYLAPTMAQLLLTMVPMTKSHVQCQWIFWNLAKSLSEFNDWLKLRLRALRQRGYSTTSDADLSYHDLGSGSGHASHAGSSNALHLTNGNVPARTTHRASFQRSNSRGHRLKRRGSENSVDVVTIEDDEEMDDGDVTVGHTLSLSPSSTKSNRKTMMVSASAPGLLLPTTATIDENTAFHGQPMTSKHSIRLPSLAVSASQPTLPPLQQQQLQQQQQQQQQSTTAAPTFAVGDRVDGNVTLTNGTQRWFPGKVTAYHADDDTYDLLYDDGDKGNRVKACDVRLTKRRVRTNNNNNNNSSSKSGQTAPQMSSTPASETTPLPSQSPTNANRTNNMLPILSPEALPSTTETTTTAASTATQLLKPIPVTFANTKSSPSNRPTTADMEPAACSEVETDDFPPKRSESPNILAVSASSDAEEMNISHARPGNKAPGLFLGIAGVASQSQSDKLAALSLELSIKQVEADDDVDKDEKGSDQVRNKDLLLVDEASEDDDEDDDDHIFEIPSIFDQGHRATNGSHLQHREDLVPRMQFTNLPISSSGIHSAPGGLSLSAALLADDETTSSSFVSNGDTPNGGANLANNSLYNLNGLKVLSGRQTPSMVLSSHRGSVLNNVGALSTTRSIMTTHRSMNNDQFVAADEGYLSIHRGSHHNLAHTFSGSMGHNTPSHLHIGNFHSALQQQQQQSHPYHTPVSAGRNAGDLSASTVSSVPTNTTRVLTWRGSANSMPGHGNGSHGDSSSSRLASGRTMMLHSNGATQAGGSTSSTGGSDAGSRRPSIAPPEQLLNASHETRHLMHRASGTASHSGSRGQLRQRPSLSRQDSATRQGTNTSAAQTGLANLSPSKRGLLNPHSGSKRSASPASNTSAPSKQQAMLTSSPPVGGNGAEMTACGTNISPSAAMMMLHAIPDETLLLEEQVAFRLLLQTHVLIALALVEFSVHQEEYAFTYLSQWATPALSSMSFTTSQKYDTSLSSMPQFPSLPTSAMLFQPLKYASCVSQEHVSAATVAAVTHPQPIASTAQPAANELFTLPPSHRINMLFHVREFFELCPELWKEQDVLSTLLLHQQQSLLSGRIQRETSFERALKLLSPMFFPQEMMQKRMQLTGERIGDGGFGSVFKMRLTLQDDGYVGLSHCLACYLQLYTNGIAPSVPANGDAEAAVVQCTCWRRTVTGSSSTRGVKTAAPAAAISTSVAVKRIARERSMFDESTLYALYQELTCLQAMQSCIGVCGLEQYGVCGSEYWMVMEHGRQSLLDWRLTFTQGLPFPSSPSNVSHGNSTTMNGDGIGNTAMAMTNNTPSKQDLFVMLLLWQDILLIVDALHRADIGHFDLKACNFLLRHDPRPYLAHIVQLHNQHQMSGFVFLADFGEAIPAISHPKNDALRRKCRGTLAIQSPEMLCISEDAERTVGVHSGLSRGFGSSTHLLSQKRGGPPASLTGTSSRPLPLKETESALLQQMNRHGALGDRIADHSHISLAQWIRHGAVVSSPGTGGHSNSTQRDDHDDTSPDEPIDGIWQIARASPISLASPAAAASVSTPLKPTANGTTTTATAASGPIPRFSPELERRLLPDTDNGSQKSMASMSTRMELGLPTKRSDLWSLGSLLCELLTGKMLFEDAQWVELFTCLCLKPLSTQQGVLSLMKHHFQKVDAIFTALLNEGSASLSTSMEGAPSVSQRTTPNNRQQSIKKLWDDVRHLLQLMLQQRPDDRAGPLQLFAETERMLHLHFVAELTEYTNQSQSQSPQYATRTSFVDGFNANKSSKTAATASAAAAAAASKSRKQPTTSSVATSSTNDHDNDEILSAVRLQRREEAHLSSQASSPNGPSKKAEESRFKDDDTDQESPRFWMHMWQELRRDEQQPWMVPVQERVLLLDEALACALLSPLLEKHAHVVKERRSQVHGRVMLSASTKGNKSIVGVNSRASAAPLPSRDASSTPSPCRQALQRREALRLALAPLVALVDEDTWLAPAASATIDATKTMTQTPAAASLAPVLQLQGLWQADLEAFFPSVWRDQRQSLAHGRGAGGNGPLSRSRCNSATSMLSTASGNGGTTTQGDVMEAEAPLLEVDLSPDDGDALQPTPRLSLAQRHLLGILYQRLRREVLFTVDMTLLALQSATSVRPPPSTLLPITAGSSAAGAGTNANANNNNNSSSANANVNIQTAPRKPSLDVHSFLPKRTGSGSSSHRGNRPFYSHLKPSSSSSLASSSSPTTHHKQPPAATAANNNSYYPYFVQPSNAAPNSNNNSVNYPNATSPPSGWPAYSNNASQNNSMRRIGYLASMGSGISGISLSLMSSASNSISRVSHHTHLYGSSHHAAAAAQLHHQQCLRGAIPTPEMMQGRLMASSAGIPLATNQATAPHVAPPLSVPLSTNQRASLGGPAVGGKATAHPGGGVGIGGGGGAQPTTANGANGTHLVKRGIVWIRFYLANETPRRAAEDGDDDDEALWEELSAYGDSVLRVVTVPLQLPRDIDIDEDNSDGMGTRTTDDLAAAVQRVLWQHRARLQAASCVLVTLPSVGDTCPAMPDASLLTPIERARRWYHRDTTEDEQELFRRHAQQRRERRVASDDDPELRRLNDDPNDTVAITAMRCWWAARRHQHRLATGAVLAAASAVSSLLTTTHLVELHEQQQQLQAAMVAAAAAANADGIVGGPRASFASVNGTNTGATPAAVVAAAAASTSKPPLPHHNKATTAGMNKAALSVNIPVAGACPSGQGIGMGVSNGCGGMAAASAMYVRPTTAQWHRWQRDFTQSEMTHFLRRLRVMSSSLVAGSQCLRFDASSSIAADGLHATACGDSDAGHEQVEQWTTFFRVFDHLTVHFVAMATDESRGK